MSLAPVFHGTVTEQGELVYPAPVQALMAKCLHLLAGKSVDVTVRIHRNQRSSQANRYYFGVVVPLIAEHCGYEKDELHELLAMRFLRIEDDPVTGSPRRKRTPTCDSKEFAEYVDSCVRFGTELGVWIPAPGEVAA